jgi:hypothetical protein
MYANGQGVPQDRVLSHMWANSAASGASDASDCELSVKNRDRRAKSSLPLATVRAHVIRAQARWRNLPHGIG